MLVSLQPRSRVWREPYQDRERRSRQGQACGATDQRQHHAFHQQLPDDARASRTDSRADCDLPLADRGPRQQYVRNVQHGDEQNERTGRQQNEQRRARVAGQFVRQRLNAQPRRRLDKLWGAALLRPLLQHIQFGHGPLSPDAWGERCHHIDDAAHRHVLRGQWKVSLHRPRLHRLPPHRKLEAEILRQHAGDGTRTAVHGYGPSDDMRIGGELVFEQIPGEHHGVLLSRSEQAAESRTRASQCPEIACDHDAAHLLCVFGGNHCSLLRTVGGHARI
jgi:hypothetical protein